jgi:hypothetical protein
LQFDKIKELLTQIRQNQKQDQKEDDDGKQERKQKQLVLSSETLLNNIKELLTALGTKKDFENNNKIIEMVTDVKDRLLGTLSTENQYMQKYEALKLELAEAFASLTKFSGLFIFFLLLLFVSSFFLFQFFSLFFCFIFLCYFILFF